MLRRKYRKILLFQYHNGEIITYKLKFIDSYRFMQSSLSNLVDNLSGVYDKECKKCMERKKLG